ncbi:MAG: methyltransferase [Gammaproteobacteria bacterium]|nr:methyltransferase [Gammaproteobacteria bacterium]NNF66578.1 class I SAM-dependent methyltransferase [Gammaproteobacteria bacterium]
MTAGVSYAGHAVTHDYQIEARLADLAVADHRSSGHIARNPSRHPVETLMFFGIKPDMTVVEISPGGSGWYTEILAPFLRDHGVYHVGSYDPQSEREYYRRNAVKYNNKLAEFPEIYDRVQVGIFEPPGKTDTVAEGTADMVLTFRNSHNWLRAGVGQQSYDAFYRMLKPGGIFGVVQHRARPGTDVDPAKGYITEEQIISMAQKAGFSLQASSQVNANPMDTADHPEGVWTLPPSLRLKEVDREKYLAIGESDRMTLKFIKD